MVPFSSPRIDKKIIDEVVDTLKSGWITTGQKTQLFEQNLSSYCGNKRTLCVNSATSGLELVLRWFGIYEGDEVIVPVYTYCATANVVLRCGAKPVMIDINESDFNISAVKIREAITKKTKAIIPVDIGGYPCDYSEIVNLVNSKSVRKLFNIKNENQNKLGRILVISDAAHSLGSSYHRKKTGSITDVTVFSFHAVKNLTTGEGGAIALNLPFPFDNDEIHQHLSAISQQGQNKNAFSKTKGGEWKYDVIDVGYKMNMPDILASIGLVELSRYENDTLIKLKYVFDYYNRELSKYDWAVLPKHSTNEKTSSYHLYQLRIFGIDEQTRDIIIKNLARKGVSVNVHFQPLPLLSLYKNLKYNILDFPNAYKAYCNEISLPLFYNISKTQMKTVIELLVQTVHEIL